MINPATELDLVHLTDSGEQTALELIYSRYIGYLTAVCSRYIVDDEDVKDVLQESFLKIFASLSRFRYRGEGSLKALMTKITVNETLKFIGRTQRIDYTRISAETEEISDEEPDVGHIPASIIHSFIRELPDGYRLIFNLYVIEGKSHKEIARLLDIKESTSASQLHRAKALLAAKINKYRNKLKSL